MNFDLRLIFGILTCETDLVVILEATDRKIRGRGSAQPVQVCSRYDGQMLLSGAVHHSDLRGGGGVVNVPGFAQTF